VADANACGSVICHTLHALTLTASALTVAVILPDF
jgi:hypothetical protein